MRRGTSCTTSFCSLFSLRRTMCPDVLLLFTPTRLQRHTHEHHLITLALLCQHQNISRGRRVLCHFCGFSGVGAVVASFVPTECSGGRGMWGTFGKPLKRAIWNTLGLHAVLTTCLRFLSVVDGACVACCLFFSTGSCHVFIQIHASPDAPQKLLTRKRARSGGAEWVQVTQHEPGSRAKKPRTSPSQPPACSHKEHDILTTAEATAFAAQF